MFKGTSLVNLLRHNVRRRMSDQRLNVHEKPVENLIQKKLQATLKPTHLEIINESYMHNVPKGSETHFRIFVVSEMFNNESLIKRHQLIHGALEEELKGQIHALSIQAKTPEQYQEILKSADPVVAKSPPCLGGFRH